MHLRVTTKRLNDKTYRYAQLVESYRRADGMPAHRVIANLGDLPAKTLENLKLALRASRDGSTVVIAPQALETNNRLEVEANLRYLDVAVMLEMWRELKLGELFAELLPDGRSRAPFSDMVAALAIQRAIAPRSTLYAKRWFPTSALPELMGLAPRRFNNTRLHKVLRRLHECTEKVQIRLPDLYQSRHGGFISLFLDTTDTYFEGRSPEIAKRSRTKAGHDNKRTIGIVLLSNELGYPLRWKTVPGRTKDHVAMGDTIESLKSLSWVQGVPLMCDRAMGNQATVRVLLDSGLHFLTAAHVDSIESYTTGLPANTTSTVTIGGTEASYKADIAKMAETARSAGMVQAAEYLFVLDLGVVEVELNDEQENPDVKPKRKRKAARESSVSTPTDADHEDKTAIGTKDGADSANSNTAPPVPKRQLRLVGYFNPMMFVDQRNRAKKHLDELYTFIDDLNKELREASQSRQEDPTRRKIMRLLEKRNWVDLFDVTLHPIAVPGKTKSIQSFRCEVRIDAEQWVRRQRYNGFVLLLGHPNLSPTGPQLALMYREKDTVEKDFQTIKSIVKLRPIFHYTDPKVRAHITVCMLALLLQRALEQKLRSANLNLTAAALVEALGTCHLNLMKLQGDHRIYTVTAATTLQREILGALQLSRLIDDSAVSEVMIPRLVST